MSGLPADVANEALDAIGSDVVIGDLTEGTREAQVLLRKYGQCVRQLLRSANWGFARKQAAMTLLADATSQTPSVGTTVIQPWTYEYAYPIDCMKARFVPQNYLTPQQSVPGNISIPNTPLYTSEAPAPLNMRIIPARWLEATDFNYPVTPQPSDAYQFGTALTITGATRANPCVLTIPSNGLSDGALIYISNVDGMTQLNGGTYAVANATTNTVSLTDADTNPIDSSSYSAYVSGGTATPIIPTPSVSSPWGQGVQWWTQQGLGPAQRTVICTNVQGAQLVYTAFVPYPSQWDSLFRAAFVAFLASEVALPLAKDKKWGLQLRQQQMLIAKDKIMQARVADGNEGWYNTDHAPDFIRTRYQGYGRFGWGEGLGGFGGPGYFYGGWDDCCGAGSMSAY